MTAHRGKVSTLCPYTRNKQEVRRCVTTDCGKHLALCGSDYKHQLVGGGPLLCSVENTLKQPCVFATCGQELEIV